MRTPLRAITTLLLLLCAAAPVFAQTASDFYLSLLRRGTAAVEAGRFEEAATPLRVAAFGLVDTIDHYERALVHLAITQDRLGNADAVRDTLRRLLAAERVDRRFASLQLPTATRESFTAVAQRYLTAGEVATLNAPAKTTAVPPAQPPAAVTREVARTSAPPASAPVTETPKQPQTPAAQTAETKPEPAATAASKPPQTPATRPAETKPATPAASAAVPPPAAKPPAAPPAVTAPKPQGLSAAEVAARFAAAERALESAQLAEARQLFREIADAPGIDRDSLLRAAEGFYRARDFAGTLAAFKVIGTLRRGEEPYGYYRAVALYETGSFDAAKKELDAALPFIESTPDVVRYRTLIHDSTR